MPRSLQGRVLALVLGLVAAVWVATAATMWIDTRHELDELLDSHLAQAAALLVVHQVGEIEEERTPDAPTLHRYAPKVAFQVFHGGRLVVRSANAPERPMLDPARFSNGFRTIAIDGTSWRVFAAHGGERDVQVFVGEQVASRISILRAVLAGALWPLALALPLLAIAVWWAVHRGTAPMRRLGHALAARQPQALEPVALQGAPSEMVPMVEALNGLFERIRALLEAERRFTADAAHELRTPLAAIRAQAQVARGEADDARRRHALDGVLEGCDRVARLMDQLLTLARLEASEVKIAGVVDLAAVTKRVAAELAPGAIARHQRVELEGAAPAPIRGDEALLGVLVRNLVDNAVRYSPREARVRVRLEREADRVTLSVEDSGAGMAEPDRRRLGERFFRVAGSGESGSGLGWSIVRRVAAVHGLELRVEASELGGLAVRVTGRAPA